MNKTEIKEKLSDFFHIAFEEELIDEIAEVGIFKKIKENELLIDINDKFDKIPLLINGAIKISREDKHGEEIVLYFLERGDTCTVSFGSCLGTMKSQVRGIAEKDSEVITCNMVKLKAKNTEKVNRLIEEKQKPKEGDGDLKVFGTKR